MSSTHCLRLLEAQVDRQSLKEHVQETTQQETQAQERGPVENEGLEPPQKLQQKQKQ